MFDWGLNFSSFGRTNQSWRGATQQHDWCKNQGQLRYLNGSAIAASTYGSKQDLEKLVSDICLFGCKKNFLSIRIKWNERIQYWGYVRIATKKDINWLGSMVNQVEYENYLLRQAIEVICSSKKVRKKIIKCMLFRSSTQRQLSMIFHQRVWRYKRQHHR